MIECIGQLKRGSFAVSVAQLGKPLIREVTAHGGGHGFGIDFGELLQPFPLFRVYRRDEVFIGHTGFHAKQYKATLQRTVTTLGEVGKHAFLAQHCINRFGDDVAIARPEFFVLAKKR